MTKNNGLRPARHKQEGPVFTGQALRKERDGGGPLYLEVKQLILDRIYRGEWQPNHRIPSENELVSELGISKMTANRALRELAHEGELVRVQGVGSFVAQKKGYSALFEVRNIAEEIAERGHVHSASVIVLADQAASPDVADALDLPIGAPVFHSLIVHHENDVPVQIEDRFVNPALAPDYLSQDFSAITPNVYLSQMAPLTGSEHVVESILAQPWEAKLLVILHNEPCLMIRRRTWSSGGVVSLARLIYPGTRYRLESRQGKTT